MLNTQEEESFKLDNVALIISGKDKKVNIFMDKSTWSIDQTITCVIDLTAQSEVSMLTTYFRL